MFSSIGPACAARLRNVSRFGLTGSSYVFRGDRRERDKLDGIDLDLTGADPVFERRARPGQHLPSGHASAAEAGRNGEVFNAVAEEYDRHRPAYPDALIDQACVLGGLGPGATVLEIGCGTGQLTRSLLARGLRVTAIEPGDRLMARARDQLGNAGEVEFVKRRLEEASLPRAHYSAAFSGSAMHLG